MTGARRIARYFPVARVAHLERLASMVHGDFLYTSTRQDWDGQLAATIAGVERVRFLDVALRVARGQYAVVEIPEPLALPLLPRLSVLGVLARLNNTFRRASRVTFTFYAIENLDQVEKLRSRFAVPTWLARSAINLAMRCVMAVTSRVAFGTQGSLDTYRQQMGERAWKRVVEDTEIALFTALAPADPTEAKKSPKLIGFLGSLEERKGVLRLLEAWPSVGVHEPEASLEIIGHGPLQSKIEEIVASDGSMSFLVDPPRAVIKEALRSWHVLVLLSQRTPTWREQIGLPILEGLSAGCEVVTTTESGIAEWLQAHGHRVVEPDCELSRVADALLEALADRRSARDIQDQLPQVDGRIQADRWMLREHVRNLVNKEAQ